ncbi:MAG TPA: PKD domain-containing protein, partial [Taishania sp.]|nr:PKD domain-containing protein [Taishania sp.]
NIADTVNAALSPVGPLWRQLRTDYPALELYSSDESHPSTAGSYAAACSFYAVMFKRPVAAINYNFSLNATDAATIRTVAQQVVYDNLSYWQRFEPQTTSDFTTQPQVGTTNMQFSNLAENASSVKWNFGDNTESTTENPTHTYAQEGDYTVCLTAYVGQNCDSVTICKTVTIAELGLNATVSRSTIELYPNPTTDVVTIKGELTNGTYEIVDVLGNKVQQGVLKTDKTTLQVQALKTGVYFIFIHSAEGKQQLRFVKK